MHPLLARPERLAAYLGVWLVVGVLIAGSLSRQGLAVGESLVLVLPLFLIYSFICLSAWYVCRAVPLRTSPATNAMVATIWIGRMRRAHPLPTTIGTYNGMGVDLQVINGALP